MTRAGTLSPARGFSLVEAVITMLLVAVGLLTMGATFMKLSRSEDVGRQRSEATRLVVDQVEAMRAYTQIAAGGAGVVSWTGLAGGEDRITTNAEFTRRWTLSGTAADTMRTLRVDVTWADRSSEAQTISMSTVIARTDPADVGVLGFPLPANTTLKRPKNRNLNIPVPASDLGNGESAFRLPGTNFAVVFSNESGYVVKQCSLASGVTTITLADLRDCSDATAYILAGYISLNSLSSFPSGLSINTTRLSGLSGSTCSLSNAVDQTTGTVIAGYRYYLCVVSMPASGAAWSGSVRLAAPALNSGSNYRVCRFQYPAAAGISANQRNVQPYDSVAESLDSQNYLITDASSCPTVSGLATTVHQTCANSNQDRATDCPAS
jgi:Tfp pilus assembly protein PilV